MGERRYESNRVCRPAQHHRASTGYILKRIVGFLHPSLLPWHSTSHRPGDRGSQKQRWTSVEASLWSNNGAKCTDHTETIAGITTSCGEETASRFRREENTKRWWTSRALSHRRGRDQCNTTSHERKSRLSKRPATLAPHCKRPCQGRPAAINMRSLALTSPSCGMNHKSSAWMDQRTGKPDLNSVGLVTTTL